MRMGAVVVTIERQMDRLMGLAPPVSVTICLVLRRLRRLSRGIDLDEHHPPMRLNASIRLRTGFLGLSMRRFNPNLLAIVLRDAAPPGVWPARAPRKDR